MTMQAIPTRWLWCHKITVMTVEQVCLFLLVRNRHYQMEQWMETQVNIGLFYCEEKDESNGPWLVSQYKALSLSARFCCVCGGSVCRENHKDSSCRCRLLVTLIAAVGCPKENDKMTCNCCIDNSGRFLSVLSFILLWASIVVFVWL